MADSVQFSVPLWVPFHLSGALKCPTGPPAATPESCFSPLEPISYS